MRAERALLRLGEYLVGRACQRLPQDIREGRHREWAAELPAILHDPQVRLAPRRAVRMLGYAADTYRGTALMHVRARRQTPAMAAALSILLIAGLLIVTWNIWNIARAPGTPLNYLRLAWSLLLVAYPVSMLLALRRARDNADRHQRHPGGRGLQPLGCGAGTSGLGELLCGSIARPSAPGIVARQPMGPRQADISAAQNQLTALRQGDSDGARYMHLACPAATR